MNTTPMARNNCPANVANIQNPGNSLKVIITFVINADMMQIIDEYFNDFVVKAVVDSFRFLNSFDNILAVIIVAMRDVMTPGIHSIGDQVLIISKSVVKTHRCYNVIKQLKTNLKHSITKQL